MTPQDLLSVLGWCTLLNYGVLTAWFLAFITAHDFLYFLHTRWFNLSVESFDRVHYAGMAVYKVGILLFNLVPLTALWLLRP